MFTATHLLALLLAAPAAPAQPRPFGADDLLNLVDLGDPALSPDGRWAAYTQEVIDTKEDKAQTDIWMVPLDGGEAVRLTSHPKSETLPRFSPDGRWLAFLAAREGRHEQVYLLDRRGGEAVKLTDAKADVEDLVWSPDSATLALVIGDVDPDEPAAEEDEPSKTQKTKPPIVITRRQFKRDGTGYLRELRSHVYLFDLRTKESRQLTHGPYDDKEPAWSPDGRSLAFTSNRTEDPDANQNTDVFVVGIDGDLPRRLTDSPGTDASPVYSPDGRSVAFVQGCDPKDMWYGPAQIAVVPVAGGAARSLTASLDRNATRPRFSHDGRALLFLIEDRGNSHVARVLVSGGPIERVVVGERDVQSFEIARDARLVVRESTPQRPFELSVTAAGGELRRLTHAHDALLTGLALGTVERFQVKSPDGTTVDAFLTLPPGYTAGQRLPTILRIHGGPTSQYSTAFEPDWQILAAQGYAVVAANPRGSTGYGLAFSRAIWADWGNLDLADVLAAVDAVVARGIADPERLGVGGWSYGGILTNYVITKTTRFKAAVSGASESNYFANYGHDHYQYEWETELGLPWRNVALWQRLSPWFQIEAVKTPTLVLCGQEDWNVPLINSEQLYLALRRLGVPTELVVYPGEDHEIETPSYRVDRYRRYLAWYDKYLRN